MARMTREWEVYINFINDKGLPLLSTYSRNPDYNCFKLPKNQDGYFLLNTIGGRVIYLPSDKIESIECVPITDTD